LNSLKLKKKERKKEMLNILVPPSLCIITWRSKRLSPFSFLVIRSSFMRISCLSLNWINEKNIVKEENSRNQEATNCTYLLIQEFLIFLLSILVFFPFEVLILLVVLELFIFSFAKHSLDSVYFLCNFFQNPPKNIGFLHLQVSLWLVAL